jgi:ABC-type nitrate/sulfonate/bicarbonate transport system ATPase subunit
VGLEAMSSADATVIDVRGLTVRYGDFLALENVDFTCRDGEFVAIVGRSGTGKTSLLNALAGLIPFEGQVEVRESMGYVFQAHALFPWMTVADNISFGLGGRPREERRLRVREMLERIELADLRRRYPSQLSGGQIQRVALARALAPDPEILLMDEPYGALDHLTRERMQSWLLSVWQETRKTVLFVTHYIEEAVFLADRIVVVRDSRFVADLEVPFSRPRHDDVRYMERFLDVKHEVLDYMGALT